MKLSEVIKALEKDPNKAYVSNKDRGDELRAYVLLGSIKLVYANSSQEAKAIDITRKWEEVKQPVTWQEAIEAWMEGKSISCKIKDRYGSALYNFTNDVYLTNSLSTPISCEMLQSGKWYIGEEE